MSILAWILSTIVVGLGVSMVVGLVVGKALGSMTTDALRFLESEQWTTARLSRSGSLTPPRFQEASLRSNR